jgi:hypothetical protein
MKFQCPEPTDTLIATATMTKAVQIKAVSRQPNGDGRAQVRVG